MSDFNLTEDPKTNGPYYRTLEVEGSTPFSSTVKTSEIARSGDLFSRAYPAAIPRRIADKLVPEPNTGCLLWEGATNEKGYGLVWFEGRKRRLIRVLFKIYRGRWPRSDREVLHRCDTPACGAEKCLREGTTRQNARDRQAKGRTRGAIRSAGQVAP
jgi:hypothetical protein